MRQETDGFADVLGYKIYHKSFGTAEKGTLLCLHGGPGVPHNYLLSLAALANDGYRVVFYDQSGCGKSEIPKDRTKFVMERYVEEVEGLRKILRLGSINLFGSSCGGQLAIAYALKYQRNLKSLITAGALANVPFVFCEIQKMVARLPKKVLQMMRRYEAEGDYDNPEYLEAVNRFYRKHVCRLKKWPNEVQYAFDHTSRSMYHTMNGPNEFTIIGNIRYWNVESKLHTIRVPTLVTCGRYDEVSPREARNIHRAIRGSRLVVFPRSSHLPFWEERGKYMQVVRNFLDVVNC